MSSQVISVDVEAFAKGLEAIREELEAERGQACLAHLKKMERWGRAMTALGYATSWMGPNPVSIGALSLGRTARWVLVAHPVSHKAYDKIPEAPERLTSRGFARGWRRMVDWFDWIHPEAWHEEHDIQHHYKLGEEGDPDVVQDNLAWLRDADLPEAVKAAVVGLFAVSWKYSYYAPAVFVQLHAAKARREARKTRSEAETQGWIWNPLSAPGRDLYLKSLLTYGGVTFIAIPAAFLPLGPLAAWSTLVNSVLAEVVTNIHTFVVITTNHCGEDVPVFETPTKDRTEFYVRQIVGSVNYKTGGDLNDALHGWLNYQIEHHLWPDMTLRQYQLAQPRVQALCEAHGVPYIQESIGVRLRKTLEVMIGRTTQKPATIRRPDAETIPSPPRSARQTT